METWSLYLGSTISVVVYIFQIVVRTSDSLNEELSIKMAREKFLRNAIFSMKMLIVSK